MTASGRPLRVLHVIASLAPRFGGPSAVLPQMCDALADRGHTVEVMTTTRGLDSVPDIGAPLPSGKHLVTYFATSGPDVYGFSRGLGRALRERVETFDVIHIHSLYLFHTAAGARAARRARVPYVIRPHGTLDEHHRQQHRLRKAIYDALVERRTLAGAAFMHYTCEAEARQACAAGIATPGRVVPLGVDVPPSLEIERDPTRVVALGRLARKKGLDILIDAFALVRRQHPTASLIIAGPDSEGLLPALERQVRQLGLSGSVQFVGPLGNEDKWALLAGASVFALPSADENFAVAAVEAIAAGTPVVLSPHVGVADRVADAGAGIVVERNANTVADAVASLLERPDLRAEMGAKGRRLAESAFSWERSALELEAAYYDVIERAVEVRKERAWAWTS